MFTTTRDPFTPITGCNSPSPWRSLLQVVGEQAGIDVEGHRGGGVSEHLLDGLDVRARGDQEKTGARVHRATRGT